MVMLFDGEAREFGARNKGNKVPASFTETDDAKKKVGKQ